MKKMFPNNYLPCGICEYIGHGVIKKPSYDPIVVDFYKCTRRLVYTTDDDSGGDFITTITFPTFSKKAIIKAFVEVVKNNKAMTKDELDQFLLSIT